MILKVLKKKLMITTFAHIQSHETQTLPWFEHKITLFKIRYKWCKQTCSYRRGRHKFQSWALKHWALVHLGVINTRDMKVYFLGLKELTAWNKKCKETERAGATDGHGCTCNVKCHEFHVDYQCLQATTSKSGHQRFDMLTNFTKKSLLSMQHIRDVQHKGI